MGDGQEFNASIVSRKKRRIIVNMKTKTKRHDGDRPALINLIQNV